MTAPARDTVTTAAATRPARRAHAGAIWLSQRDIDGLLLCGEHYAAPYDLLATALRVHPSRFPAIAARWRRTGYVATGRLGQGPRWCWLTRDGMAATGLGFPAARPALARLAHIRAVLAVRIWMQASPAWTDGRAWWHSERRLRADHSLVGHVPDAEIHWPSIDGQPVRGPGMGDRGGTDPQAHRADHPDHDRARRSYAVRPGHLPDRSGRPAGGHPGGRLPAAGEQDWVAVRDLPGYAFTPEPPR